VALTVRGPKNLQSLPPNSTSPISFTFAFASADAAGDRAEFSFRIRAELQTIHPLRRPTVLRELMCSAHFYHSQKEINGSDSQIPEHLKLRTIRPFLDETTRLPRSVPYTHTGVFSVSAKRAVLSIYREKGRRWPGPWFEFVSPSFGFYSNGRW
jgi:hypothetical protein